MILIKYHCHTFYSRLQLLGANHFFEIISFESFHFFITFRCIHSNIARVCSSIHGEVCFIPDEELRQKSVRTSWKSSTFFENRFQFIVVKRRFDVETILFLFELFD